LLQEEQKIFSFCLRRNLPQLNAKLPLDINDTCSGLNENFFTNRLFEKPLIFLLTTQYLVL
jgi:hypothetical protein